MFLEAQFGPSLTPITRPKLPKQPTGRKDTKTEIDGINDEVTIDNKTEDDDDDLADLEAEEMERLHSIGIPVPGVEIKVDKHIAKVWLENLEVECQYGVLRDRVKAVIERAVETIAPLWGQKSH